MWSLLSPNRPGMDRGFAPVTGRPNIRRDGKADVLEIGVKALGEHRRQNVMRSSQHLSRAWLIDRRHPVLHVHPQTARELAQDLAQQFIVD